MSLCVAGGEALQVSTTAAQRAAEEARSGKWLEELESGKPLRARIPGMDRGAFGAWALDNVEGDSPMLICHGPLREFAQLCCALLSRPHLHASIQKPGPDCPVCPGDGSVGQHAE